jgi:hypothetical protein
VNAVEQISYEEHFREINLMFCCSGVVATLTMALGRVCLHDESPIHMLLQRVKVGAATRLLATPSTEPDDNFQATAG